MRKEFLPLIALRGDKCREPEAAAIGEISPLRSSGDTFRKVISVSNRLSDRQITDCISTVVLSKIVRPGDVFDLIGREGLDCAEYRASIFYVHTLNYRL